MHANEEGVQGDHIKILKVPSNGGIILPEMQQACEEKQPSGFQMPLHYPRYKKTDYEKMEEWKVELLLKQYGLSFDGTLDEKRAYAMGAFLWPNQYWLPMDVHGEHWSYYVLPIDLTGLMPNLAPCNNIGL
jgi:hypothetical protein